MTRSQATRRAFEVIEQWSKAVGGIVLLVSLIAGAWVQFLGPGLRVVARDFLGITEIVNQLEEIEAIIPPPTVVQYNEDASNQIGVCTSANCVYVLTAYRTEYGAKCGKVIDAQPFLRTGSGQLIQINYRGFTPIELDREPRTFQVPLNIPAFVPPGEHQWKTRLLYESCPGRLEPIARNTPWLPITVSSVP